MKFLMSFSSPIVFVCFSCSKVLELIKRESVKLHYSLDPKSFPGGTVDSVVVQVLHTT
jgi:type III secretory pathway component EscT